MAGSLASLDPLERGGLVVITDMSLAVVSVVLNLIVVTAIKEKEASLGVFNVVLANLCLSNLASAVLVKSISIVHNGHAVAANTTHSDIAFCLLLQVSHRTTWAVLPWSTCILAWLVFNYHLTGGGQGPGEDAVAVQPSDGSHEPSPVSSTLVYSSGSVHTSLAGPSPPAGEGPQLSLLHKGLLGGLWTIGALYSLLSQSLTGGAGEQPCSVREDPSSPAGAASVLVALLLPLALGPLPVLLLLAGSCLCRPPARLGGHLPCLLLLTIVHVSTYSVSMVLAEVYFEQIGDIMHFILLKYCFGTLHHLLSPLVVLLCYPEVRRSAARAYSRGGSNQNQTVELSDEKVRKELGIDMANG